jgi:hypothetical protein
VEAPAAPLRNQDGDPYFEVIRITLGLFEETILYILELPLKSSLHLLVEYQA